jgi:hypothetical protein
MSDMHNSGEAWTSYQAMLKMADGEVKMRAMMKARNALRKSGEKQELWDASDPEGSTQTTGTSYNIRLGNTLQLQFFYFTIGHFFSTS